jgi:hypothetical protein
LIRLRCENALSLVETRPSIATLSQSCAKNEGRSAGKYKEQSGSGALTLPMICLTITTALVSIRLLHGDQWQTQITHPYQHAVQRRQVLNVPWPFRLYWETPSQLVSLFFD